MKLVILGDRCHEISNIELDKIASWLALNKLSLNIKKCKAIIFHNRQRQILTLEIKIKSTPIEIVEKINFLGITIDKYLSWNSHISEVCLKISKIIGVMFRLKNTLTRRHPIWNFFPFDLVESPDKIESQIKK